MAKKKPNNIATRKASAMRAARKNTRTIGPSGVLGTRGRAKATGGGGGGKQVQ